MPFTIRLFSRFPGKYGVSPSLFLLVFLLMAFPAASSAPLETGPAINSSKPNLPGYFIKREKKAPYALVLVHGITGDGISSWTSQEGTYWPKLMRDDPAFDNFDIYVYQYPTSLFGECLAVSDLATAMRTHLKNDSVFEGHENVIFLAHSMGGLVVRTFLLRYRETADKVPMLIFFATPSAGSRKANSARFLPTCSQVDDLQTLDVNSFLKNQQDDWSSSDFQDRIASYCAFETQASVGSLTVERGSATLQCTESQALLTDHSKIVKPDSTSDLPHIFVKNALSDLPKLQKRIRPNSPGTTATPSDEGLAAIRPLVEEGYVIKNGIEQEYRSQRQQSTFQANAEILLKNWNSIVDEWKGKVRHTLGTVDPILRERFTNVKGTPLGLPGENNEWSALDNTLNAKIEFLNRYMDGISDKQLRQKSEEITDLKNHLTASITGGTSFAYIIPVFQSANAPPILTVVHKGEYPLYDLRVRIVDLAKFGEKQPSLAELKSSGIGDLPPNQVAVLGAVQINGESLRWNLFFSARNGTFTEELRVRRVGGDWKTAIQVKRNSPTSGETKTLFEKIDPDYPRGTDGKVEW